MTLNISEPRFEPRWANGCWNCFDTVEYTVVKGGFHQPSGAAVFGTQRDAAEFALDMNVNGPKK